MNERFIAVWNVSLSAFNFGSTHPRPNINHPQKTWALRLERKLTGRTRFDRHLHPINLDLLEYSQVPKIPLQPRSNTGILPIEAHISSPALHSPLDFGNVSELDAVRISVELEVSSVELVDEEVSRGYKQGGKLGEYGVAVGKLSMQREIGYMLSRDRDREREGATYVEENESGVNDIETIDIERNWVLKYVHLFELEVRWKRTTHHLNVQLKKHGLAVVNARTGWEVVRCRSQGLQRLGTRELLVLPCWSRKYVCALRHQKTCAPSTRTGATCKNTS